LRKSTAFECWSGAMQKPNRYCNCEVVCAAQDDAHSRAATLLLQQELANELDCAVKLEAGVFLFGKAAAFVFS
jgi:hypothetical protein